MAAAGGVSQGAYGFAKINSTVVLIRTGASLAMPRNPEMPHPISGFGNAGIQNFADGLQFPVVNLPAIPMDTGAANWLTAANLNAWFITKSGIPVGDLSELTSLYFSDNGSVGNGKGIQKVLKSKGAGFTLVARKGQGIGLNLRFAGRSLQAGVIGDRPGSVLQGAPLMFDRIALGGAMDGLGITGFTLQYDCGTTPNMELDGTIYPVEQNAGLPSCSLTIEYNALDTIAQLGYDPTNNTWLDVDSPTFTLQVVGGGMPVVITFTMSRLKVRNPFDLTSQANRAGRTRTYDVIGNATVQAPLGIA